MTRTRSKAEQKLYNIRKLLDEQFGIRIKWSGKMRKWIVEGLEEEK